MRATIVLAATAVVLASAAGAAEPLPGDRLDAALAGATTSGVNVFGNPYTVHILPGGLTEGVAGHDGEYVDSGSWWIDGDSYCRRWNVWLDAQTACFAVVIEGDRIHWHDTATGTVVTESYAPPP